MTDVVFSARLWTKLPTSIGSIQKSQIVSHVLSNVLPRKGQRDAFLAHLRSSVENELISEENAASVQLSQFVDEALALELTSHQQTISEKEYTEVVKNVLNMQRRRYERMVQDGLEEVETDYLEKISALELDLEAMKLNLNGDIAPSPEIEELSNLNSDIDTLQRTRANAEQRVGALVKKASSVIFWFIMVTFVVAVFLLSPAGEFLKNSVYTQTHTVLASISAVADLVVAVFFAAIGWYGVSAYQLRERVTNFAVKKSVQFFFSNY